MQHYATTPNIRPTPAVSAIASAPQKVTLIAPTVIDAPPARAAIPPRRARKIRENTATTGYKLLTWYSPCHHQWKCGTDCKSTCRRERRLNRLRANTLRDSYFISGMCSKCIVSHKLLS